MVTGLCLLVYATHWGAYAGKVEAQRTIDFLEEMKRDKNTLIDSMLARQLSIFAELEAAQRSDDRAAADRIAAWVLASGNGHDTAWLAATIKEKWGTL